MSAISTLVICLSSLATMPTETDIAVAETLPLAPIPRHAAANRPPLAPSPLAKLKVGAIEPRGWLKTQLDLEARGFVGRLRELSGFCSDKKSGWLGHDAPGWEEVPYWLKGLGDLAYVLKDAELEKEARRFLDAILASQRDDGGFGPKENEKILDMWPNMVVLFALQSFHEATGDPRVIPFMARYFAYQLRVPEEKLLPDAPHPLCWQRWRAGDNIESVYWLYNRTGDRRLLDLAERLHRKTADWTNGIPTWHGVNITMGFRQPGVFFQQSKDPRHLAAVERNYRTVMDTYGRQAGGMFAADENARPGKTDPRQAAETCSMVEFMYSFESLLAITGDAIWADRLEEVAFNSFPASVTPDWKGLRYLTAANMPVADSDPEKKHEYENKGEMASFNPWRYRCCQHNVAQGWPYFAERLFFATAADGLAAPAYAPCAVSAVVGDGVPVRIVEETEYPFGERVAFTVSTEKPVEFPLWLRIPEWCAAPSIEVGDRKALVSTSSGRWIRVTRTWSDGDRAVLGLPMEVDVKLWPEMKGAVSVRRGPLYYSLRIEEDWRRYAGTDEWPAFEVLPKSPWNYGLVLDHESALNSFETVLRTGLLPAQPFVTDGSPVSLRVKARRIPYWGLENGTCGLLPQSPVASSEPVETVTLVPMGGARLRITSFPVIGEVDARD